jgi:hypothetical protein
MKPAASQPINADLSGALAELRRLVLDQHAALAVLAADVRELRARQRPADPRGPAFAQAVYDFLHGDHWSAQDLLRDARRCNGLAVLRSVDAIVGDDCDNAAIAVRLGKWLAVNLDCIGTDFLRLERGAKRRGVYTYRVIARGMRE